MSHELVAGALRARGWSLGVLAGADAPAPDLPAGAWELFLRGERCGLALRGALGAERIAALPAAAREPLQAGADRELQRAMAGRAQVRHLGRLVAERGWTGIALKGGALLAQGDLRVDVGDIDLLLPRQQAFELGRLLDARGARKEDPDPWEHSTQYFHLAARTGEYAVPVEVHFRIPFAGETDPWRAPRPSGTPGIALLAPADHLWHVMVHGVDHHLERRGFLRDVVLLHAALEACGEDDLGEVEARAAGHRSSAALRGVLGMARALAEGRTPDDPFPAHAALRYLLASGAGPFELGSTRGLETTLAAAALLSGLYRRRWFGDESSVLTLPSVRGNRWLDRRLPFAVLPARAAWRGTRLALVTLPALRLARAARRAAEAAA